MRKYKFYLHEDAGHGWLAVKRSLLEKLNLLDSVSGFSYQKGGTVYLEEDCDAGALLGVLSPENYEIVKAKHYDYSPIRNYNRYTK